MLIGYMRVSSNDERQSVSLQRDALIAAGVDPRHLHQDHASGARDNRPGLKSCLAELREGDVLIVWKLDRLGRSLSHLLRIIEDLKIRGIAFRSLTESIDTTTGTVAKLAMRQPFVLFKGLTFQKLCLPGAFRPGD
ncbi:recombinase family protein, partial [Escherichia coli]|uniref:recombinase family protein n=2 Tax=Escherichia coli TaxID=562 RepID=UPI0032183208